MKTLFIVTLVVIATARPARPCSIHEDYVHAYLVDETGGEQPWITAVGVNPVNVTMVAVTAICPHRTRCEGTIIRHDVVGTYIRPSTRLAAGTRLQVIAGTTLMGDFLVGPPKPTLAGWKGMVIVGARGHSRDGRICVDLDFRGAAPTLTFLYWSPPDPMNPLRGVDEVLDSASTLTVEPPRRQGIARPVELWVAAADSDGHITVPRKIL